MTMRSIKGFNWLKREINQRDLLYVTQKYDLSPIAAEIILARLSNLEQLEQFIAPSLKDHLPDPYLMKDMEKAAKRVVKAVVEDEKIVIFGDYDVDGATSSALIARFFMMIGFSNYQVYIPDRIKEGYGPNSNAFQQFVDEGAKVIITVDCGTLSFEPIALAYQQGVDVIVLDHHLSDITLPKAYAIVNPNRLDENFEHRNLAAVGVSFFFIIALNRLLREAGCYDEAVEPNLMLLLDLVALGTVCDVMTLTGVNRLLVASGLKVLLKRKNPGLAALMDVAAITDEPGVYHLGYLLGPRINAGGRVGRAELGSLLLRSDNYNEAYKMAVELNSYNNNRKSIEQLVLEDALIQAETNHVNCNMLIVSNDNWHPGVIGIVCARIKEKYHKPVAVIAFEGEIGKASLRSIPGVDIGAAVVAAKNQGLLMAGGGHAMAAGFTVHKDNLVRVQEYFDQFVVANQSNQILAERYYDITISASGLNHGLYKTINCAAPFGNGNEEPLIRIDNLRIVKINQYKNDVTKLILCDKFDSNSKVSATIFKASQYNIDEPLLLDIQSSLSIIGKATKNDWNGRNYIELMIEDLIVA